MVHGCIRLSLFFDCLVRCVIIMNFDGSNSRKQFVEHLYEAAGRGDVDRIKSFIKTSDVLNDCNDRGWNALMFASRNGKSEAVKSLLDLGCIYDAVSNSGQSALDIAKFWNHVNVIRVFEDHPRTSYKDKEAPTNFFGYNPLDRCAVKRSDDKWLESTLQKDDSVFLLYSNSYPLVKFDPNGKPQLCQFRYNNIRSIIDNTTTKPNIIFLGAKCKEQEGSNDFNEAWFAVDATGVPTEQITDLAPGAEYLSGAGGLRLMQLHESIAGIVAQGRSLLAWHARYKFCPTCGNKTFLTEAGYKRKCENDECINHREIHNSSYPRTDPVVIMLVVSSGGDKCLLGRAKSWPAGMYSCLAGFMEPGETIEDAVRREVAEETGVKVGRVMYHSNQTWPRPSTLMIGCIGFAMSEQIILDDELEDAKWFSRQEMLHNITGHRGHFMIPTKQAIAHQLIKAFLGMSSSL